MLTAAKHLEFVCINQELTYLTNVQVMKDLIQLCTLQVIGALVALALHGTKNTTLSMTWIMGVGSLFSINKDFECHWNAEHERGITMKPLQMHKGHSLRGGIVGSCDIRPSLEASVFSWR